LEQCSTYDECVAKTLLAFCKICSNNGTREKWQEAKKFGQNFETMFHHVTYSAHGFIRSKAG